MGYVVGLMSGTSLDGVDVALVKMDGCGITTKVEVLDFLTIPFSTLERQEIEEVLDIQSSSVQNICSLNFKLGHKFAEAVNIICEKNNKLTTELDAVSSHGQTIWHQPLEEGRFMPSTLQIGEPAIIAYKTGAKVVSNFRTMDMAAGGLGAPLVPYTEWLLYRSDVKSRALQNIGGIGNVTVIPKAATLSEVTAFDTGPGNMIIDELCLRLFSKGYDEDGYFASQGCINEQMLTDLMNTPYLLLPPPKTTGRELFGKQFVTELLLKYPTANKYDILATATMFTAKSIAMQYEHYVFPICQIDEMIIGGGGSYNKTLVQMLRELLHDKCKVMTGEDFGYASGAKEAIAFAVLANETLHGIPSNVPSVTGAKTAVILGNITLPPNK